MGILTPDELAAPAVVGPVSGYLARFFGSANGLLSDTLVEMCNDMAAGELVVNRTVDYGRLIINGVPVEIQIRITTQTNEMVNPGGAAVRIRTIQDNKVFVR